MNIIFDVAGHPTLDVAVLAGLTFPQLLTTVSASKRAACDR